MMLKFLLTVAAGLAAAQDQSANGGHTLPRLATYVDQIRATVLDTVPPPSDDGAFQVGCSVDWDQDVASVLRESQVFIPPTTTLQELLDKPFHFYDPEFYTVTGPNPTLTLLNHTDGDLLFQEAPVWYVLSSHDNI